MSIRQANASVAYSASSFGTGPLKVTWPNFGSPLSTYIEQGLEAIGIEGGSDIYSGTLNGSGWAAASLNAADQTRDSSETSYFQLVNGQTNVKVYLHTMALKINFSGTTATGVNVETIGLKYTLKAKKEVIVSAGAFQSPQLLMVSGIGPQATLQSNGISVIKNLAGVGQNLWDHLLFGVVNKVNVVTATSWLDDIIVAAQNLALYFTQKGPLTASGFGVLGFQVMTDTAKATLSNSTRAALAAANFPSDWPEFEFLGLDGILAGWHNSDDQDTPDQGNYGSIGGSLLSPLSRGTISISSSDMKDPPIIDMKWLSHAADQELVVYLFKRMRDAWAESGITIGDEYKPGPDVETDEQILAYIKSTVAPVWHPSGTCKMGKSSDSSAVVDSKGRVFGVSKLRVVDASIFPTLPPGHPQSTCYMVAEKIAADIKAGN
jgi:choline dehydrogenase